MDPADYVKAVEANKLVQVHQKNCKSCSPLGSVHQPSVTHKRCAEGTRLFNSYMEFQPAPLIGRRVKDLDNRVIDNEWNIGNITIYAYRDDASYSTDYNMWETHDESRYSLFVDGGLVCIGVKLLDDAVLMGLSQKYTGDHGNASYYAAKVLEMPTEE